MWGVGVDSKCSKGDVIMVAVIQVDSSEVCLGTMWRRYLRIGSKQSNVLAKDQEQAEWPW